MESLIDRARRNRESGAVLKTRLSIIRSRYPTIAVFVFEGDEDVGPYEAWTGRIRAALRYEPLPGKGKDQVLDLRMRLKADTGDLGERVYFFVDRDFDGLKGHPESQELFCTDRYSTENYLVSERVLASILTDEFRCIGDNQDREKVLQCFRDCLREFHECMREPNRRIFQARRMSIRSYDIADAINRYATITLEKVTSNLNASTLPAVIRLEREPTAQEVAATNPEFDTFSPERDYRGKFTLSFFYRWLDLLIFERKHSTHGLFCEHRDIKFSITSLSLRSLAARSDLPGGLAEFVAAIPS